jgi:hypothetical protein
MENIKKYYNELKKLKLCLIIKSNYFVQITLFGNKKETYKKLYLECCRLWMRNMDPTEMKRVS